MPTLNWIGKDKVINHHQEVPFKVLEHQYTFGAQDNSSPLGRSGGAIIHGDNLEALKALLPQYEGKIKCIYIDPPYNTGNENWVYNDNVNDPKIKKWLGQVVGKESEDLSRHDKWLCMMYPRLKLLHKLLADDGAIFISIDDNEQANLKLICDEIFGGSNFVANISWKRKKEISNDSKNISIQGEYLLCYSKSNALILNSEPLSEEYIKKSYKEPTEQFPLGKWRPVPLTVSKGLQGGGYEYTTVNPNGTKHKKIWAYPENGFETLVKAGLIYYGKNGDSIPQRIMYLKDSKGQPTTNYWDNTASNKEGKKEILNIFNDKSTPFFDTPKPTQLIERILQLTTDKNSIVLDSFAGSGTTAHAVLNLNKQDGGNRKFILIEMEDYAENITAERVKRVINGYGSADSPTAEGTGGSFDFYKLGQPLFDENHNLNESVGIEKIKEYIWYSETKSNYDLGMMNDDLGEEYFLGKHLDTAYYFYYEKDQITTLDFDSLELIKTKADQYIIYADNCLLPNDFMYKNNIVFKKIPRDISKL